MRLSHRIQNITGGGADGWDHFRRAQAMKRAGRPVVELTIGEHDIRTDPAILDEMRAAAGRGHTGYSDIPGIAALRAAIAERCTRSTGHPAGPENVLVTPGGQFALFSAHMAVCEPGDEALYIDPYYATYPGTIRAAGAVPVRAEARAERGFQPLAEDVAAASDAAASLLINSPNNPTGAVYSAETLQALVDLARERRFWIISDEVYDSQIWQGRHLSPRAMWPEGVLVCGSLSKSHAMTGSRLGWVCGPADAIEAMANLATHTTYGIPGYIQDAGLWALRQGPDFEARIAAPFARRRAITAALVAGQNVVQAVPMAGAMYAMLDVSATGLDGEAFAARLLDDELIAVMPGNSFGQAAKGHIRVAMTVEDGAYRQAVTRLLAYAARLAEENRLRGGRG